MKFWARKATKTYESHSFIDTVKLAVKDTNGRWYICALSSAIHSEKGNVLPLLLYSDNQRTDTLPNQEIYLTFTAPTTQPTSYIFIIEGYNPKPP